MTEVTIYRHNDYLVGFLSIGHADETGDNTIGLSVCAGISALTQTTILSIIDVVGISEDDLIIEQEDGYLSLRLLNKAYLNQSVQVILESLVCGLKEIHKMYQEYIDVQIQEV